MRENGDSEKTGIGEKNTATTVESDVSFLADQTLGKLAKELRMLGCDTLYYRGKETYPMIQLARKEGRMILTRNTRLAPRMPEDRIFRVVTDDPLLQMRELVREGLLSLNERKLFSRCLQCNDLLKPIPQEEARGKIPDYVFYHQERFVQCPRCRRIFWKGSHEEDMQRRIHELFGIATQVPPPLT
jgi:uncharacterized protein